MSHRLSASSDDSSTTDKSSELPPLFNCDGNQEENLQWKFKALHELKKLIKELNSDFDENHPTLTGQIKKLQKLTDELESMHKKNTEGSLAGAALGAAGGIASTVGLCLAPFTFGASLALTGVGAAVGIAGGATSATYTITNMIKPKNLRKTIEKIINDVQNTIKSMIAQLSKIYDNIEKIEQLEKTMEKEGVTTARSATDLSELKNAIDSMFALAVKDMLVFVQAANIASTCVDAAEAAYVAARAAKVARVSADAAKAARVSGDAVKAARMSAQAAKVARVSADIAKAARASIDAAKFAGRATGILSAVFVVFDVVSVVQHATELSEINQSADKRNEENIKSDTLKFIYQVRQKTAVFQKTLDNIECSRKTINQEFDKMLQSSTSSQAKPRGTIINNNSLFFKCL